MTPPRDRSTPESIADALRDDLLDGRFPGGSRITEESLVDRFGAGRHSVRAALGILVAEGLLAHQRNRGIVVPAVTSPRIDAMCDYRAVLELGALRLALDADADLAPVVAAVERLEALPDDTSWRRAIEAHSAIHRAIVGASGNERLIASHHDCENELNAMLAILALDFTVRRLAELHRTLVDALLRGGEDAVRALEHDLEHGGRAGMHHALVRGGGES